MLTHPASKPAPCTTENGLHNLLCAYDHGPRLVLLQDVLQIATANFRAMAKETMFKQNDKFTGVVNPDSKGPYSDDERVAVSSFEDME